MFLIVILSPLLYVVAPVLTDVTTRSGAHIFIVVGEAIALFDSSDSNMILVGSAIAPM